MWQSVTKIMKTQYIFIKTYAKKIYLPKDTKNFLSTIAQCSFKPEKLCQWVLARTEEANIQLTLNKRRVGGSLTIFITNCLQILKNVEKDFFKDSERIFFRESGLSLRGDYLSLGICGTSIFKNLTNRKHKYLKINFCNPI